MECSICEKEIEVQKTDSGEVIWDQGHNAEPVNDGRCCGDCNVNAVIPARLYMMTKNGV
jgi:putative lipase involved disintegration of autophagic bodies|tara:strand:+ start:8789 stop:8965 length:177 start_codon:yes stop_codon:yes gene_type:complete